MKRPQVPAMEHPAAKPPPRTSLAIFEWSAEYLVGIRLIDEQHQQLIKLINDFYLSLKDEGAKRNLFDGMLSYARYHFATEEQYMREQGYPEYPGHQQEHEAFTAKALDLQARFKAGELVTSLEATNYLRKWLSEHILQTDKRFGAYVQRRKTS